MKTGPNEVEDLQYYSEQEICLLSHSFITAALKIPEDFKLLPGNGVVQGHYDLSQSITRAINSTLTWKPMIKVIVSNIFSRRVQTVFRKEKHCLFH